ncbi:hypothetical protein Tco_1401456 [Tanacetum coccineum]
MKPFFYLSNVCPKSTKPSSLLKKKATAATGSGCDGIYPDIDRVPKFLLSRDGNSAVGYGGAQNRIGKANPGQARQINCYICNGGQDNAVDEDVDEQPVQDLALTVDNVFQADDCDAFDSNVDEAPTAQTMFMANLSSANPVYD